MAGWLRDWTRAAGLGPRGRPERVSAGSAGRLTGSAPAVYALLSMLLATVGVAPAHAGDVSALATILDGEARLLRDSGRLALAEGVRVGADDIIELGPQARFMRLEFDDASSAGLGPGTRVWLAPRLAGDRGKSAPRLYLLQGWLKIDAAKDGAVALATPWFDVSGLTRSAVVSVQSAQAQVFAEAGEVVVRPWRPAGAAPITLKAGEMLTFNDSDKTEIASRPTAAFLQAVPRTFLDTLPARAAKFKDQPTAPKRVADLLYADVQEWVNAEPALRKPSMARWKALSRNPAFRKGLVDDLKAHPEWQPVLFPPPPASAPRAAFPASGPPVKYLP